jgi:hypothetical protein
LIIYRKKREVDMSELLNPEIKKKVNIDIQEKDKEEDKENKTNEIENESQEKSATRFLKKRKFQKKEIINRIMFDNEELGVVNEEKKKVVRKKKKKKEEGVGEISVINTFSNNNNEEIPKSPLDIKLEIPKKKKKKRKKKKYKEVELPDIINKKIIIDDRRNSEGSNISKLSARKIVNKNTQRELVQYTNENRSSPEGSDIEDSDYDEEQGNKSESSQDSYISNDESENKKKHKAKTKIKRQVIVGNKLFHEVKRKNK